MSSHDSRPSGEHPDVEQDRARETQGQTFLRELSQHVAADDRAGIERVLTHIGNEVNRLIGFNMPCSITEVYSDLYQVDVSSGTRGERIFLNLSESDLGMEPPLSLFFPCDSSQGPGYRQKAVRAFASLFSGLARNAGSEDFPRIVVPLQQKT